jgi:ADP-heptose:LPS heptosyltransferase
MIRSFIKRTMDFWIELECRFVRPPKADKKKVLLLRKDVLGDFIIFIPTLALYREYYKDYELSLVVSNMSQGLSPVFSFVDKIITFDQKRFRTNFWYRRSFIKALAKGGFNIVIYPVWSREPIGDLMVKVTKAAEKITFKTCDDKNDSIYSKIIEIPASLNEIDRNMAFVSRIIGKKYEAVFPTIDIKLLNSVGAETIKEKYSLLSKKYCVLFPGAGARYRIWQLSKFAEISDYINELGFTPVICGSPAEGALALKIRELASNKNIVNIAGQTDIPTLAHIIYDSKFYFGSETGVLHLACSLNIPTVTILGGGHFGRFFPYGDSNSNRIIFDENMKCKMDDWKCAANLKDDEIAPCIKDISVESAKKEIDLLLKYLNKNENSQN